MLPNDDERRIFWERLRARVMANLQIRMDIWYRSREDYEYLERWEDAFRTYRDNIFIVPFSEN